VRTVIANKITSSLVAAIAPLVMLHALSPSPRAATGGLLLYGRTMLTETAEASIIQRIKYTTVETQVSVTPDTDLYEDLRIWGADFYELIAWIELKKRVRDLALFNLAIDSKLRACDLTRLKVEDIAAGGEVKTRGIIVQKNAHRSGSACAQVLPPLGRLSFPEQTSKFPSPFDQTVCADRPGVGGVDRAQSGDVRHALTTPNQSGIDLSKDRQPARCAVAAWAFQARKHGSLSWC
jgi:hypothetical protein